MAFGEFAPLRAEYDAEAGTSEEEFPWEPPQARSCGMVAAVVLAVLAILGVLTATVTVAVASRTRAAVPSTVEGATMLMYPFKKNKTVHGSPCTTLPPAPTATATPVALATTTPAPAALLATGAQSAAVMVPGPATLAPAAAATTPVTTPTAVTTCPPPSPCATLASLNASFVSSSADYFVQHARQVSPAFQEGLAKSAGISPCNITVKSIVLEGTGNATIGSRRLLAGSFIVYYSIVVHKAGVSYEAIVTQNMKLLVVSVNEALAALGIVARVGYEGLDSSTTIATVATTTKSMAGDASTATTGGVATTVAATTAPAGGEATTTAVAAAEPEPEPEPESEPESRGNTLSGTKGATTRVPVAVATTAAGASSTTAMETTSRAVGSTTVSTVAAATPPLSVAPEPEPEPENEA